MAALFARASRDDDTDLRCRALVRGSFLSSEVRCSAMNSSCLPNEDTGERTAHWLCCHATAHILLAYLQLLKLPCVLRLQLANPLLQPLVVEDRLVQLTSELGHSLLCGQHGPLGISFTTLHTAANVGRATTSSASGLREK
eukprot:COSAG01_NODE_65_length_29252_cov_173.296995_26_plen_141_part_00